jgi:hypothetical protein
MVLSAGLGLDHSLASSVSPSITARLSASIWANFQIADAEASLLGCGGGTTSAHIYTPEKAVPFPTVENARLMTPDNPLDVRVSLSNQPVVAIHQALQHRGSIRRIGEGWDGTSIAPATRG